MSENTIGITVKVDDKSKAGFDSAERSANRLKGTLKEVGKVAAGVLTADMAQRAGAAFGRFVGDSVRQASALNESMNAVQVTFKQSGQEIINWGKQNAASFGLSRQAFQELATPLGAMLQNAGLSMQDATKWTIDLTKRSADMASVFNVDVSEALTAIQAGLRGEADPLERFGVGLSAAKVEARALADTGKTAASSLSEQEKATARLNIIMDQTAKTQGDFANTSTGSANAARIASAEWDNAKASLGQGLLPIMSKGAQAAAELAGGFNAMPGPLQATLVIAGTLGTAFVLLAGRLKSVKSELASLADHTIRAEGRMGSLARATARVGAVLAATQIAGAALGKDMSVGVNTASTALEDLAATGKKTESAGLNLENAWKWVADDTRWDNKAANTLLKTWEGISGTGAAIEDSFQHAQQAFASTDAALASMVSNGEKAKAAGIFEALSKQAQDNGVSVEQLKRQLPQYADALEGAARQNKDAAGSAKDLNAQLEDQAKAADKAANAVLDSRDAARNLEAAYDDARESIKKNGKTLDDGTEKGRANQEALDKIASSAYEARDAILAAGGGQRQANAVMVQARTNFLRSAQAAGMGAAQAKALADKLFAIPKAVSTKVTANTTSANAALDGLITRLAYIAGRVQQIKVLASAANVREDRGIAKATGGIVGAAATGGIRSNSVLVGEQGPEIVDLAPGSRVHSSPDTERILSSSSGMSGAGLTSARSGSARRILNAAIAGGLGGLNAGDVERMMDQLMARAKSAGDRGAVKVITSMRAKMIAEAKNRQAFEDPIRAALAANRQAYAERVSSVRAEITGAAGIGGSNGSYGNITARLQRQVERTRRFAGVLAKLRKMGLDRTSIDQLVEAGPEAGLKAAESILANGAAGVQQIAGLQRQVALAGGLVGAQGAEVDSRGAVTQGEAPLRTAADRRMAGKVELLISSGGSKMDDLLVEVLRKAVRAKGGNVQRVLGAA